VLINAVQNARRNDITRVTISGPQDAVIVGAWAGTPFTVTLHDGTPNKNDSLRVQYGSFDTSTLTARCGQVFISNR
jgi:hypothetical protein